MSTVHRRLFFGLDATPLSQELIALQQAWGLPARAIPAANFHLTLLFLGQCDERQYRALAAGADEILAAPLAVSLDESGWFPRAQVAWVGQDKAPAPLLALARSLHTLAQAQGLCPEPLRLRPHISLYRKAKAPPPVLACPPLQLATDQFHLYESVSTPEGVRYLSRKRFALRG
ncbi:RNA 2',3'-cyclic phosphodiesterase [Pseudaeromonas paramecii]|uniref:RNA 2',3'-cyclic phosphodiesterase n=1 Tax=Pseudaeromonas paramecii TaxID=2138166 RepID=A0ABP8Q5N0_9GAMM